MSGFVGHFVRTFFLQVFAQYESISMSWALVGCSTQICGKCLLHILAHSELPNFCQVLWGILSEHFSCRFLDNMSPSARHGHWWDVPPKFVENVCGTFLHTMNCQIYVRFCGAFCQNIFPAGFCTI